MKQLALVLSLGGASLWLAPTVAAQTTDSTSTKPQLNTGLPTAPARNQPTPAPVYQPEGVPAEATPRAENVPAAPPQVQQAPTVPRRFFLYSNFGLGFSSNPYYGSQFNASIAPAIGYRVTERLALGPGISYAYNRISPPRGVQGQGFSTNSFGVKGFMQFIVFQEFFLHGEYEVTRAEALYQDNTGRVFVGKTTVNTPLLGAGYRQQFGDRAAGDITLLYNFNDGINDIYGQPVVRFSFLFDLK
ncbi:hypothetical protein FY528_18390 [Hymenobacter lutimineralis]|uniref:Outer membrane beta-barrel protein n=1 Tax=Hymenobacter lutimineralis TaxID=2606448 RepID=A0A5D6US89_9BACT|nr:hypothetical protein [Hymenobacter lutimineralis]TYZ06343.1 hypothetical protein FY528_18390 [Hymenobacter lutimineralis]